MMLYTEHETAPRSDIYICRAFHPNFVSVMSKILLKYLASRNLFSVVEKLFLYLLVNPLLSGQSSTFWPSLYLLACCGRTEDIMKILDNFAKTERRVPLFSNVEHEIKAPA